jgi:hypothetical protein
MTLPLHFFSVLLMKRNAALCVFEKKTDLFPLSKSRTGESYRVKY